MPSYRFTPEALDDLNNIVDYTVDKWGKSQAKNYVTGLNLQASRLAQTPALGLSRRDLFEGLFSFPFANHILYYVEVPDGITIIRVLHKNMDIPKFS